MKDSLEISGRTVSMDAPLGNGEDTTSTLYDVLVTNDNAQPEAERELESMSLKTEIDRSLATLDEKSATVLRLYYGLGGCQALSLEEIAKKVGLTSERVRQIKAKAIRKLKDTWRNRLLRPYL